MPSAVTALIRDYLHRAQQGDGVPDSILTPREEEVLKLIARGYSACEIAKTLGISAKTVGRHRTNTLQKLGLHERLGTNPIHDQNRPDRALIAVSMVSVHGPRPR